MPGEILKRIEFDDLLPKCSINEIIYDYEKWNRLKNEATKKKTRTSCNISR